MIAQRARWHPHRAQAETLRHLGLRRRTLLTQRCYGTRPAPQHGYKDAPLTGLQPLHVPTEFVDPDSHLKAKRGRDGMLAMRAPRNEHRLCALGQIGQHVQQGRQLLQKNVMRLP